MSTRFLGGSGSYPFPDAGSGVSLRLASELDEAAARLTNRLAQVDVYALPVSAYFQRYLTDHIERIRPSMQLTAHLLYLATRDLGVPLAKASLVDYGGGPGMLALLAREAGVGTVVYNDIYDVSCADARTLAAAVGLEAHHYVPGDIGDLISHVRAASIECRTFVSSDVIEHVYDIDTHLKSIPKLTTGPLRVVMATTANGMNPVIRWRTRRVQRQLENAGSRDVEGRKQRDTPRAYRAVREDIARARAPRLSEEEVHRIGVATRGMIQSDVDAAVDAFQATGRLPEPPSDPTNTCDPYTGNWAERLMDPNLLAETLAESGIPTVVRPGYWGEHPRVSKRMVSRLLNTAVRLAGGAGLFFSPTYILVGDRT